METPTKTKRFLLDFKKQFVWMLVAFIFGVVVGDYFEKSRVFNDCRYAGVTRIGQSAFKCDQFSKVILLTPAEQLKPEVKK